MKVIFKNKALSLALLLGGLHVVCDLLGSLTFFPITHYGMYSAIEERQKSFSSYELVVNGKKLDALDYRIHIWEALTNPLAIHQKIKQNNDFEEDKRYMQMGFRMLKMSGFYPMIEQAISNKLEDDHMFGLRYKKYLTSILNEPIVNLQVYESEYGYENAHYFLIRKTLLINE